MTDFGIWSLLPPVLAIMIALIFKNVILALVMGIFSGTLLICGGNIWSSLGMMTDKMADSLCDQWNIRILMFCALLGSLVSLLNRTGSVRAFGEWAASRLKHRKSALFFTFFFGILIFIDDYFNSLSVGTAMRPVCDRLKISRAKLAWLLDSTAAPICIIAPISSWVVTVMSYTRNSQGFEKLNVSEFDLFIRLVPYNFYVFLTIFMILIFISLGIDYGPMLRSEKRALAEEGLYDTETYGQATTMDESEEVEKLHQEGEVIKSGQVKARKRAGVLDMIIPFGFLIISAVISFPVTAWKIAAERGTFVTFYAAKEGIRLKDAFCQTDASRALMYSIVFTLFITSIYFFVRHLVNLREISDSIAAGIKSMVPALVILVLAWTISSVIKNTPSNGGVGLANYMTGFVHGSGFPFWTIPCLAFVLAGLLSFSTGTSWGTMAILIPIVFPIIVTVCGQKGLTGPDLLNSVCFSLSAAIGGAVWGDHVSPISDTTILSAAGAGCPCLEHVATQIPYAVTAALSALFGYLIGAVFGMNLYIGATSALIFMLAAVVILKKIKRIV